MSFPCTFFVTNSRIEDEFGYQITGTTIDLIILNIPRIGEFVTIYGTSIFKCEVLAVCNIYTSTNCDSDDVFTDWKVVPKGSFYYHIILLERGE